MTLLLRPNQLRFADCIDATGDNRSVVGDVMIDL
jgi:hypothetical protein